ncbi:GGDEF domain-containing protein [Amycolatopsis suaedae]|nr:GGDEF domain-containing protein [Amycolatopsis suaedae]
MADRPRGHAGWTVWSHSVPSKLLIVSVEVAAAVSLAASVAVFRGTWRDAVTCGLVVACGLAAAEVSRRAELRRRLFADTPHVNFSSVWTLAGALVLPPALAAVVTVVLYAHLWWRSATADGYVSRFTFNACNVILSCHGTAWVAGELGLLPLDPAVTVHEAALLVATIAVYFLVNSAIAAVSIALVRDDHSPRQLLGSLTENLLELATLCLGAITALLLAWQPALIVLIFVPLYAVHRTVLPRQLEHAATTDVKTGLLNAVAWRALAEAELERVDRRGGEAGILMIDLDHFRRINNDFGHLAGDAALRAVADAIRGEVPDCERLCGRFGGEEFVVTVPGASAETLERVAGRICRAITRLRVTGIHDRPGARPLSASIGGALYPAVGPTLQEVLLAADAALLAAKYAGRNRVRVRASA